MNDTFKLVVPFFAVFSLLVFFFPPEKAKMPVIENNTVSTIGACNTNGYCGVLLDNGKKAMASYPVVGESLLCKTSGDKTICRNK